ncbi:hypothetical protein UPYG_G00127970 [Umbra pygmaea]|uniref:Uncharacterized protein n=1 Tax=Umbra pygmaea TaxID=75934 RepID=A0ABD0X6G2_UMBPY
MQKKMTTSKPMDRFYSKNSKPKMEVIEVEEFLRNPPPGFTVEANVRADVRFVKSDPEYYCVFIDNFESSDGGKVVFQHSPGKKVKVRNLRDYTCFRKSITSKKIYLLVSACEEKAFSENKVPQSGLLKDAVCIYTKA